MFGQGGSRVKTGVQWAASWLEPLGFGIVDQISEAATLDEEVTGLWVVGGGGGGGGNGDDMFVLQGKCEQRYKQCEKISLKETFDQVEKHRRNTSVLEQSLFSPQKSEEVRKVEADLAGQEEEKESAEEEYEYYYEK